MVVERLVLTRVIGCTPESRQGGSNLVYGARCRIALINPSNLPDVAPSAGLERQSESESVTVAPGSFGCRVTISVVDGSNSCGWMFNPHCTQARFDYIDTFIRIFIPINFKFSMQGYKHSAVAVTTCALSGSADSWTPNRDPSQFGRPTWQNIPPPLAQHSRGNQTKRA